MTIRDLAAMLLLLVGVAQAGARDSLVVGSKRFTESYILGEIVALTAATHGPVEFRPGLGSTAVVFEALKIGAIDVYPEYLGTLDREILGHGTMLDPSERSAELAALGLAVGVPFGFQNGYALAMRADHAKRLGISCITDLERHPELRVGLSHEFMGRNDGWPGLAARYRLPQHPIAIDHGLAYDALAGDRIQVTDIYSTDARIPALGLVVLCDDAGFFPRYDAVLLYRLDAVRRFTSAWDAIETLQGRIDASTMIRMNGDAELRGRSFAAIARGFVARADSSSGGAKPGLVERLFGDDLGRLAREHVGLVIVAVIAAAAIGIPIGAFAAEWPALERPLMSVVGVLQTIPSLAMFALLIPLLGMIGTVPAIVTLTLYALLPIVRNTTVGLQQVPAGVRDAGLALGLTRWQCWIAIELPLAGPVILAGVKTSAVISVGTATIAAFIGAGGFGERIATGLALNDHTMLLAGAIPAAAVAMATQWTFEFVERLFARRGHFRLEGKATDVPSSR